MISPNRHGSLKSSRTAADLSIQGSFGLSCEAEVTGQQCRSPRELVGITEMHRQTEGCDFAIDKNSRPLLERVGDIWRCGCDHEVATASCFTSREPGGRWLPSCDGSRALLPIPIT